MTNAPYASSANKEWARKRVAQLTLWIEEAPAGSVGAQEMERDRLRLKAEYGL